MFLQDAHSVCCKILAQGSFLFFSVRGSLETIIWSPASFEPHSGQINSLSIFYIYRCLSLVASLILSRYTLIFSFSVTCFDSFNCFSTFFCLLLAMDDLINRILNKANGITIQQAIMTVVVIGS